MRRPAVDDHPPREHPPQGTRCGHKFEPDRKLWCNEVHADRDRTVHQQKLNTMRQRSAHCKSKEESGLIAATKQEMTNVVGAGSVKQVALTVVYKQCCESQARS